MTARDPAEQAGDQVKVAQQGGDEPAVPELAGDGMVGLDHDAGQVVAEPVEGADVVISYLDEHPDAEDTRKWVEDAGQIARRH